MIASSNFLKKQWEGGPKDENYSILKQRVLTEASQKISAQCGMRTLTLALNRENGFKGMKYTANTIDPFEPEEETNRFSSRIKTQTQYEGVDSIISDIRNLRSTIDRIKKSQKIHDALFCTRSPDEHKEHTEHEAQAQTGSEPTISRGGKQNLSSAFSNNMAQKAERQLSKKFQQLYNKCSQTIYVVLLKGVGEPIMRILASRDVEHGDGLQAIRVLDKHFTLKGKRWLGINFAKFVNIQQGEDSYEDYLYRFKLVVKYLKDAGWEQPQAIQTQIFVNGLNDSLKAVASSIKAEYYKGVPEFEEIVNRTSYYAEQLRHEENAKLERRTNDVNTDQTSKSEASDKGFVFGDEQGRAQENRVQNRLYTIYQAKQMAMTVESFIKPGRERRRHRKLECFNCRGNHREIECTANTCGYCKKNEGHARFDCPTRSFDRKAGILRKGQHMTQHITHHTAAEKVEPNNNDKSEGPVVRGPGLIQTHDKNEVCCAPTAKHETLHADEKVQTPLTGVKAKTSLNKGTVNDRESKRDSAWNRTHDENKVHCVTAVEHEVRYAEEQVKTFQSKVRTGTPRVLLLLVLTLVLVCTLISDRGIIPMCSSIATWIAQQHIFIVTPPTVYNAKRHERPAVSAFGAYPVDSGVTIYDPNSRTNANDVNIHDQDWTKGQVELNFPQDLASGSAEPVIKATVLETAEDAARLSHSSGGHLQVIQQWKQRITKTMGQTLYRELPLVLKSWLLDEIKTVFTPARQESSQVTHERYCSPSNLLKWRDNLNLGNREPRKMAEQNCTSTGDKYMVIQPAAVRMILARAV